MRLKKKIIKLSRLRLVAGVVVSNDIRTLGTPVSRDVKGDGHANNDFPLVSKVRCGKFHQDRNVGQQQVLQLENFLIFLNFQNHREHVSNNL